MIDHGAIAAVAMQPAIGAVCCGALAPRENPLAFDLYGFAVAIVPHDEGFAYELRDAAQGLVARQCGYMGAELAAAEARKAAINKFLEK